MRDLRLNLHSLSKLKVTFLASGRAQVASYGTHSVIKAELTGKRQSLQNAVQGASKRLHFH